MIEASIRAVDLKVDGRTNPLGIDDRRPSLSWRIHEPQDAAQGAYRVLVASSVAQLDAEVGDLWDTGKVKSSSTLGIAYDGSPLSSRQRCYWRVLVWDLLDRSAYSAETGTWEMGLLEATDWRGEWLAAETAHERAERELTPRWFGDVQGPAKFRHSFETGEATEVHLLVASDGLVRSVFLDGVQGMVPAWNEHAFGSPPPLRVMFPVTSGRHELVVNIDRHPNPLFKQTIAIAGQLRSASSAAGVEHKPIEDWDTALADSDEWTATAACTGRAFIAQPASCARLFRRDFVPSDTVKSARLYIAALGAYEASINGRRVGNDELQSEPTEYSKLIPYRTYDVSHLLCEGPNAIGITVADGYFASYAAPVGRYSFGPPPRRFQALLALELEEGRTEWLVTDREWRTSSSAVTSSEIYNGEQVDFRLSQSGWELAGFDGSEWEGAWTAPKPEGQVAAPIGYPVRATLRLTPVSIKRMEAARFIVDFGQNFAGRVRLRVRGTAGQEVVLRHAETLAEDGELDVRNLRAAAATDVFILSDETQVVLEPRFTYHGFRYSEIRGLEALEAEDVEGVVLTSNLPEVGQLEIEQPTIQRLWLNTLWSQRSNFVGVPTDCPQRDERLGWTGDAQIFWDTAAYNMDVTAFTRAFCREMRLAQAQSGAFPVWAPKGLFAHPVNEVPTPGWADAGVELPYVAYLHSGDRKVVDENWDAMTRYLEGILALNPNGVWVNGRGADFGDHLSLDSEAFGPPTTPPELIATAMLARDLDRMVRMADWTGRTEASSHWNALLRRVRSAFAETFIDPEGVVGNGSHTSYIMALRLGLVPEKVRDRAGANLGRAVRDRGSLLTTGFLGTPLALDALADIGELELAYTLLLRTEFPSWGYMVEKGATTIWERWNGDTGDVSMNSFNHYALGAVCAFLYRRICGIEPLAPGFTQIRIAPMPDRRISSASASYESVMGTIRSAWGYAGSEVEYRISIPPNTIAQIELPGTIVAPDGLAFAQTGRLSRAIARAGTHVVRAMPHSTPTETERSAPNL